MLRDTSRKEKHFFQRKKLFPKINESGTLIYSHLLSLQNLCQASNILLMIKIHPSEILIIQLLNLPSQVESIFDIQFSSSLKPKNVTPGEFGNV